MKPDLSASRLTFPADFAARVADASRHETTRTTEVDPATGDILVVSTRRVPYGTPEHHSLLKARARAA